MLSGVPLNLVQKWIGHEDIATTAIYTDVLGPEERANRRANVVSSLGDRS